MKTIKPAPLAGKPRLTRVEQKAQRSRDLLDAARVKFIEKGYEAVTIDDVAEYAGMSRMPVYSLFGDKQNLFFELWHTTVGGLSKHLVSCAKPGQPLRDKLKSLAELISVANSAPTTDDPGMNLFFVVQTIALSRPEIAVKLQATAREIVSDFTDFISDATLEKGDQLRSDPETVAAHIVAHINGLSTAQFQTGKRYLNKGDLADIFICIALKSK